MSNCKNCAGVEWVCENHPDHPWAELTNADECCGGAGMPCGACNLGMASAGYSEPWRELALRAISDVKSAVRETSWGQPTFGPDAGEELQAEYDAMIAKTRGAS
jgi:hypothetical protein